MRGRDAARTSSPRKWTEPEVAGMRRRRVRPTVDLPQPDSPTSPSVSFSAISNDTPSTARTSPTCDRKQAALDREVGLEVADRQQRRGGLFTSGMIRRRRLVHVGRATAPYADSADGADLDQILKLGCRSSILPSITRHTDENEHSNSFAKSLLHNRWVPGAEAQRCPGTTAHQVVSGDGSGASQSVSPGHPRCETSFNPRNPAL